MSTSSSDVDGGCVEDGGGAGALLPGAADQPGGAGNYLQPGEHRDTAVLQVAQSSDGTCTNNLESSQVLVSVLRVTSMFYIAYQ